MKIHDITRYLETIAPPAYQEEYDNSGLITSHNNDVIGVLVTLDCTEDVIAEAMARNCNMVVAHHPIVFKGLKKITGKNYVERTVIKAIKHDVAIYAIHTNLDNVAHGVNKKIAEVIGLQNCKVLAPKSALLSKLYTYAPLADADKVRNALFAAGAGHIGNYSECSFNTEGVGTFKGNNESVPHVGSKNIQHHEKEVKIEVLFPNYLKDSILDALLKAHPYEEVAYEIIHLSNKNQTVGSGLIGELPDNEYAIDFLNKLKDRFNCGVIKYSGNGEVQVKKIAICGGAGFFLLGAAKAAGAHIFITADVKYHEFFDAEDKIILADVGHFESEQFTVDLLIDELKKNFTTFAVLKGNTNTNPVKYL